MAAFVGFLPGCGFASLGWQRAVLAIMALVWVVAAGGAEARPFLELRNLAAAPQPAPITLERAAVEALPQHVIRTHTEFTDGLVEFSGPLVRDVLALIGLGGAKVARMVALNDYAVEIPIDDFTKFDVILALTKNGEKMTPRDKGPMWVIYPIDSNPALNDPLYNSRMIWQLSLIELK